MKPLYFLILSGFALLLCPLPLAAQRVFVLAGQSNMLGRGDSADLSAPYDSPQSDIRYWTGSRWADLAPGTGVGSAHGPELSLGRSLADHFGESIYFVKHAEGGSSLAPNLSNPAKSWDPDTGLLYGALKTKVTDALDNLGSSARVEGFFWMQGEADSKDQSDANAYLQNFENLIDLARTDFDAPDMAVVLGRVNGTLYPSATHGDKYQYLSTVRAAQEQAATDISRTAWVDTDTFALNDDDLHFSSAGQIALGNAMAEAYVSAIPEPSAGTLVLGLLCRRIKRKLLR